MHDRTGRDETKRPAPSSIENPKLNAGHIGTIPNFAAQGIYLAYQLSLRQTRRSAGLQLICAILFLIQRD
jgi:hypothetical protein